MDAPLGRPSSRPTENRANSRLIRAARENGGDLDDVNQALRDGANVNAQESGHGTALHWAARNGNEELAKALIFAKADVNAITNDDEEATPLHFAVQNGHANVVRWLLRANAHPNVLTRDGITPLNKAIRLGNRPIIKYLLAAGASVNAITQAGRWCDLIKWTYWIDKKQLETQAGDQYWQGRHDGQRPLDVAFSVGRNDLVQLLLDAGAQASKSDLAKVTSLPTSNIRGESPSQSDTSSTPETRRTQALSLIASILSYQDDRVTLTNLCISRMQILGKVLIPFMGPPDVRSAFEPSRQILAKVQQVLTHTANPEQALSDACRILQLNYSLANSLDDVEAHESYIRLCNLLGYRYNSRALAFRILSSE
jgi:ankyrin repeat protein